MPPIFKIVIGIALIAIGEIICWSSSSISVWPLLGLVMCGSGGWILGTGAAEAVLK